MPWRDVSLMDLREEFVLLAAGGSVNFAALCRRYGISRKTGYKWLSRWRGGEGLSDRSRRPRGSPSRTPAAVEMAVVSLRRDHRCWGGRKIARRLKDLGHQAVPSASTVTDILRRHDLLSPAPAGHALVRFEAARPNALWQMDFKGHVAMTRGGRCHPLTVLDDHSRFNLCLAACGDERRQTVRAQLTQAFQRYGLPDCVLCDNGPPWGGQGRTQWTRFGVWLLRLGIRLIHSRPKHPQTLGKEERFHRTLKAELLAGPPLADLERYHQAFQKWRSVYNTERPHEAIDMDVPIARYTPSPRLMPDHLPVPVYAPHHQVRKVQDGGWISFQARQFRLPKAFTGLPVALLPTKQDNVWDVLFAAQIITAINIDDGS